MSRQVNGAVPSLVAPDRTGGKGRGALDVLVEGRLVGGEICAEGADITGSGVERSALVCDGSTLLGGIILLVGAATNEVTNSNGKVDCQSEARPARRKPQLTAAKPAMISSATVQRIALPPLFLDRFRRRCRTRQVTADKAGCNGRASPESWCTPRCNTPRPRRLVPDPTGVPNSKHPLGALPRLPECL